MRSDHVPFPLPHLIRCIYPPNTYNLLYLVVFVLYTNNIIYYYYFWNYLNNWRNFILKLCGLAFDCLYRYGQVAQASTSKYYLAGTSRPKLRCRYMARLTFHCQIRVWLAGRELPARYILQSGPCWYAQTKTEVHIYVHIFPKKKGTYFWLDIYYLALYGHTISYGFRWWEACTKPYSWIRSLLPKLLNTLCPQATTMIKFM